MKSTPQFPAWQPIDSAPKDRLILVYGVKDTTDNTDAGFYTEISKWYGTDILPKMGPRWSITLQHGCRPPTHWMPLPEAPE